MLSAGVVMEPLPVCGKINTSCPRLLHHVQPEILFLIFFIPGEIIIDDHKIKRFASTNPRMNKTVTVR